jgi:hypothetical protein
MLRGPRGEGGQEEEKGEGDGAHFAAPVCFVGCC